MSLPITRTKRIINFFLKAFSIAYTGTAMIATKLTGAVAWAFTGIYLEPYIGGWSVLVGIVSYLMTIGLVFGLFQLLFPTLEKLDDRLEKEKPTPYIDKYGADFPKPVFEDFGITLEERRSYYSKFEFELIKWLVPWAICMSFMVYFIKYKPFSKTVGMSVISLVVIVCIIIYHLFEYWNKRIAMKHPLYQKFKKYEDAYKIYKKVRIELTGSEYF